MNVLGTIEKINETQQVSDKFQKREFVLKIAENVDYPEFVSFEFIDQPNTPALLIHVKDNTPAFRFYHFHGFMQLLSAITPETCQNISGKTTAVHSCKYCFAFIPASFYQSQVLGTT